MNGHEKQGNDESPHPSIQEELCAETAQQIGYATRHTDNLPHVGAIEEEELKLFLIMQMMRIDQSEKEENGHTEEERI